MSAGDGVAMGVQVAGLGLAPLLPGGVQAAKARLQGRRGPGVLQPYRELRRLWRRGAVDPGGSGPVYRAHPRPRRGRARGLCLLVVPVAARGTGWPAGNDALLVVGLLALARVAIALSAWDTGGGFGLMGAARDLTFAIVGRVAGGGGGAARVGTGGRHRPQGDVGGGVGDGDLGRSRPTGAGPSPWAWSCCSRPGASRSTTPTPISS